MGDGIIDFQAWLSTPAGRALLAWEQARLDEAVANLFGYHAVQLGLPELAGLGANRMPHRWMALSSAGLTLTGSGQGADLITDFSALPFPSHSLDLVVLPHTLDLGGNAHACLREVERVLVPEGRLVVCGFNPMSLWGWRQWCARRLRRWGRGLQFLPTTGKCFAHWRLSDWLSLLSFEIETTQFGMYRPPLQHLGWFQRFEWLEKAGQRCWPIFGAVYVVVAVKRVHGMRLLKPHWKTAAQRGPVSSSVTSREHSGPVRCEGQASFAPRDFMQGVSLPKSKKEI